MRQLAAAFGQIDPSTGDFSLFHATQGKDHLVFDLASLTKVMVTASLIQEDFVASGKSQQEYLSTPIKEGIKALDSSELGDLQIGALLEHRSGLSAHEYFFTPPRSDKYHQDKEALFKFLSERIGLHVGKHDGDTVYSDLDYILLGFYLEASRGASLDLLFSDWKKRHGIEKAPVFYTIPNERLEDVVPTESRHPTAEVNDDNCFSMGGISGHAGLFATLPGVVEWIRAYINWARAQPKLFEGLSKREGRFCLGWDTPTPGGAKTSAAGANAPEQVRGHLGYTGCSIWWDTATLRFGVQLSNRLFPKHTAANQKQIHLLRQEFYDLLWQNEDEALCQILQS